VFQPFNYFIGFENFIPIFSNGVNTSYQKAIPILIPVLIPMKGPFIVACTPSFVTVEEMYFFRKYQ